jgi:hypothetical protein
MGGQASMGAMTAPSMPGMGGMGGGMGGMGAAMRGMGAGPARKRRIRSSIAETAAQLAIRDSNPKSRAILKKLEEPISMQFPEPTPLDDVLKYVKQASVTENYAGIPIYVDLKALDEAEVKLQSPVIVDLEGVPLKTTLRLLLKQLGLAYCVRDGVLIVSSEEGIAEELEEAQLELETKGETEGGVGGGGSQ